MHAAYLLIVLAALGIPLVFWLGTKVYFFQKWRAILWSIGFASGLFLLWDQVFTGMGVWHFNPKYILGINLFYLPLEEILYFITVPLANLFIYESIRTYYPPGRKQITGKIIGWVLAVACAALFVIHFKSLFTSITCLLLAISLINHFWVTKGNYINYLLFTWLVSLAPMVLIYMFSMGLPIQEFEAKHITGWKVGPIPVELFLYHMLYLLWMIPVYEKFKIKALKKAEAKAASKS